MPDPSDDVLLQLTDLHVQVGPGDALASRRLERAIEFVARMEPAPAGVLLTGDLVNTGTPEEYVRLAELLGPLDALGAPLLPVVGNHDDRRLLAATFAHVPGVDALDAARHVQYAAQVGSFRVLVLDTQHRGLDDGKFCDTRRRWLEEQLRTEPSTPTIVAMHHPPIPIGLPNFDAIALRADHARSLGELLAAHPQVERVVTGHVHRPAMGQLARVPVFTCPSVYLPARPDMAPGAPIELVDGPVGAGVHVRTAGGSLVSHVRMLPVPA